MPKNRKTLDELLRLSRREAPPELLDSLTRSLPAGRRMERVAQPSPFRPRGILRVAVVTAALVGALALVGGLGYAMTVATDFVTKTVTHKAYVRQVVLPRVIVNAAADQYGTTTTTSTVVESTTTETSTAAVTTTTTTTTPTSTATTTTTTTTTTTPQTPTSTGAGGEVSIAAKSDTPGAIAVVAPGSSEQTLVKWTASSFGMPVNVTVDPTPVLGTKVIGSGNQIVSVTLVQSNGDLLHELAAPIEIVFPSPPSGFVPAVSQDGVTFRALAPISGPPLPDSMDDGFYIAENGDVHVLARHVTIFAVVAPANITISESGKHTPRAGSGLFGDPTRNHPGAPKVSGLDLKTAGTAHGFEQFRLAIAVDEQAKLSLTLFGPNGAAVPLTTGSGVALLKPGQVVVPIDVPISRLRPKTTYRLRVSAVDFDGNATSGFADVTTPPAPTATTTTTHAATTTTTTHAAPTTTTKPVTTLPATPSPTTTRAATTTTTPPPTTSKARSTTTPATTTHPGTTTTRHGGTTGTTTTTPVPPPMKTTPTQPAAPARSFVWRAWHKLPNSPLRRMWWPAIAVGILLAVFLAIWARTRRGAEDVE